MNKILGQSGEDRAVELLMGRGYKILGRNFRTRFGEIDIIAQDGGAVVFVEVKARTSDSFGTAKEAVNSQKLRKLKLIIQAFISEYRIVAPVRLEVVAVQGRGEPELVGEVDLTGID